MRQYNTVQLKPKSFQILLDSHRMVADTFDPSSYFLFSHVSLSCFPKAYNVQLRPNCPITFSPTIVLSKWEVKPRFLFLHLQLSFLLLSHAFARGLHSISYWLFVAPPLASHGYRAGYHALSAVKHCSVRLCFSTN
jgi:hypothetical protein